MYKKIALGLKFIIFFVVVSLIGTSLNNVLSGQFLQGLPGLDDLRYIVGLYEEEGTEATSLPIVTLVEEVVDDIAEENPILDYGVPTRITMSSVNIDLPVEVGIYDVNNQSWPISKGKAFWAELSQLPAETLSNTVIYAHNQWTEFSKTVNLQVGDKIVVETDKGNVLTYEFVSDELVHPSWGALFDQEVETSRLTLITCNGVNDEHRRLIYADLTSVSLSEEFLAEITMR